MKRLRTLLDRLNEAGLVRKKQGPIDDIFIDHLADDSRKVGPGGLFVALRGDQADGHLFIDKAVQNGAIAIVCEAMPEDAATRFPGIALVQVRDGRAALAELAALIYDEPARQLTIVGVTGTNGKTTTAYLISHALTHLGQLAGLVGTIEYRIGEEVLPASHTTPGAPALHRLFKAMVQAGCTVCAMEVSSHALDQERVRGVPFEIAVFTNLTRDHLDYHGSFQRYLAAKKRLFDSLSPEGTALTNLDDPAGRAIVADTKGSIVTYGRHAGADIRVEVLANRIDGLRLRLDGTERRFRLVGQFNAYNLAAAYGALRALGYEREAILDVLAEAPPVPGRFEQIRFPGGTTVIVDYAHTPDALENVLQTIHVLKPPSARVWCLFGCGGDRDPSKRRIMGSIAERYADRVIVTSDNPRTEDPEAIMNDIRRGLEHPLEAYWIVNRREAIRTAAEQAAPGDIVLIAGKGHEPYQLIGTEKVPFDDREEARRFFK